MIAVLHAVAEGPWPGDPAPDVDGFRDAVEVLLAMRRRVDAETASNDDLRRYRLASAAVERIARKRPLRCLAVDADALAGILDAPWTVYTPEELPDQLRAWQPRLSSGAAVAGFVRDAAGRGDGLVISIQPMASDPTEVMLTAPESGRVTPHRHLQPDVADAIARRHEELPPMYADDKRRHQQADALCRQIIDGLRHGRAVPIGMAASHDVITEVLRDLQGPSTPSGSVRLVQVDGSESAPFPLGLPLRPPGSGTQTLHLGLMSVRHMELDACVSGYWFRNRRVSVADRTLAETEEFCYRDTLARLPELIDCGIDVLEVVHTGFEPAVIGFYRAVAAYVQTHPLAVIPRYARPTGYVHGVTWLEEL
ncbi:hypothetical protein [Streptomyces sp. V4I2]|uniref:hypothetical protein n=1 Tax=Streptomyces sp. V4I2 TaxID=3042280 RepID=UPI002787443B|nr:hypothetical protein [Streptomyces sp. V4I2]MDQ1052051.1 hypothetical protein [Streptomyces sp. V4I2]